jgi:hypothetical protein
LSVSVSRVLTLVNVLLGELLPKGEREKTYNMNMKRKVQKKDTSIDEKETENENESTLQKKETENENESTKERKTERVNDQKPNIN